MPSNILPLHHKQTFPPIIWIFTEGEGDGIKSRLPSKIFSTLHISIQKGLSFSLLSLKTDVKNVILAINQLIGYPFDMKFPNQGTI